MRSRVVLPQPDGPSSISSSPSRMDRSTPSTASWSPPVKRLRSCRISTPADVSPMLPRRARRMTPEALVRQGSLIPPRIGRIPVVTDLPTITPDYLQILVVRELRKAGFDIGDPRVQRRAELPEPERGFVVELVVPLLGVAGVRRA